MTLVGHRENDGQHLFLLQNWWKEKQFIEVSAESVAAGARGCIRAAVRGGLHAGQPHGRRSRRVLVRHERLLVELVPAEEPAARRTCAVRDDARLRSVPALIGPTP